MYSTDNTDEAFQEQLSKDLNQMNKPNAAFYDRLDEFLAQTTSAAKGVHYLKTHFNMEECDIHDIASNCLRLLESKSSLHALVGSGQFELLLSMQSFLPWYFENSKVVPMLNEIQSAKIAITLNADSSLFSIEIDSLSQLVRSRS